MSRTVGRICAGFYLAVSLGVTYIIFGSPFAIENPGLGDLPYYLLIGLNFLWGLVLFFTSTEHRRLYQVTYRRRLFIPEVLAAASLLFFLFSYIFATNANMDYVQRFITSGGNLRLALDTRTERTLVWIRVFPFVGLNLAVYLIFRLSSYKTVLAASDRPRQLIDHVVRPWAFLFTLASAFAAAISMPSFLSLEGFPVLGWFAFVPFLMVLRTSRPGHGVFYGVVFGAFHTLLSSYWLGTFSLVSLQITVVFFVIYFVIFTPVAILIRNSARWARVLVFPLAMTVFEYLRSSGFLGYPWALAAHSQYSVVPFLQMVSITGVWGLSFLIYFANSSIAEVIGSLFAKVSAVRAAARWGGPPDGGSNRPKPAILGNFIWFLAAVVAVGGVFLAGYLWVDRPGQTSPEDRIVRVAQVQQNSDPRKHEYEDTLETLEELTNQTLPANPDLIVWSETAIVPNIRRWSTDTSSRRYNRLILDFLDYQDGIEKWLVTGNDDYELVQDDEGTQRFEYNGAVLFSDTGERRETYRKIQLVPFTEYFPYREVLPAVYDLLLEFDVHFWEPGTDRTVFDHPDLKFSTPICYEDVFPNYVRGFVNGGAEAILNISNDFWSLTEVQAKQHFVAGMFRAVENRRPVLRTTASGLTGQIDVNGRIIQTAPYFEEATLVSDIRIAGEQPVTIYTRFGDFFPLASAVLLAAIWVSSLLWTGISRTLGRRQTDKKSEAPPKKAAGKPATATPASKSSPSDSSKPSASTEPPARPGRPARKSGRPAKRAKTNWRDIWDR